MTTTQTVLQGKDTANPGTLYMSFELGDKKWQLTLSDGRRGPSRYTVDAGDTAALADCVSKARARCGLSAGPGCMPATRRAATAGGCTAG
jgi:transposase